MSAATPAKSITLYFRDGTSDKIYQTCIQPQGAVLIVGESDQIILQSSANAGEFLRFGQDPIGLRLRDLGGELLLDDATAHLHRGGQLAVVVVQLLAQQQKLASELKSSRR